MGQVVILFMPRLLSQEGRRKQYWSVQRRHVECWMLLASWDSPLMVVDHFIYLYQSDKFMVDFNNHKKLYVSFISLNSISSWRWILLNLLILVLLFPMQRVGNTKRKIGKKMIFMTVMKTISWIELDQVSCNLLLINIRVEQNINC